MIFAKKYIFFVILFHVSFLQAIIIGSNTAVSVQANVVFPSVDTDNEMRGFAAFTNGFSLGNSTATVLFTDYFPVSSSIDLRGGIINLNRDFMTDSAATFISTGTVNGNFFNFSLPSIDGSLSFTSTINPLIAVATQVGNTTQNLSVDWAVTNTNLAISGTNVAATPNLRVLGFNGTTITTDASLINANTINAVRWHPTLSYLAYAKLTGGGANPEVAVYSYNAGVLTLTGSEELGGTSGNAVAWRNDGLFLTAGTSAAAAGIRLYSFNPATGVIALLSTVATSGAVQRGAMSWEKNDNFVVVGTGTANQLQVFSFNGVATLTLSVSANTGNPVSAVSTTASSVGSFIAIGISGGANNLQVYNHNTGAATLTQVTSVAEAANVLSVQFSPDGTKLAVGLAAGASTQFRVYAWDANSFTLTLLGAANFSASVNSVRWSRDGQYIAVADSTTTAGLVNLTIFAFASSSSQTPFLIRNAKTIVNSDVTMNVPMFFQGYCQLEGNGYRFNLNNNTLTIMPTSTLVMHNVILQGVTGSNIFLTNSTSLLQLQDTTWIQSSNYTFSSGAMEVNGMCLFTGTSQFTYLSPTQSTIKANSTMKFDSGMTFRYAPISNARNLLAMVDQTSLLYLLNTTMSLTTTGMQLTKGTLVLDGSCIVNSDATVFAQALSLGDGITAANNLTVRVMPESGFNITRGILVNNNV